VDRRSKQSAKGLEVYLQHYAALVDHARPLVGCRSRAEDVVQDAYLRFAPAMEQGHVRQPLGFLYRIVRNLALDVRRRLYAEERHLQFAAVTNEMSATAPTPEEQNITREELLAVEAALAALPPRTRIAFELHRFAGLTLQQIAEQLDISVTLAHQLVHVALADCGRRLEALDAAGR
jgi:RNA polymerase sigma factor (sigma-70 family)